MIILYILIPHPECKIYTNYMINYFKFHDFSTININNTAIKYIQIDNDNIDINNDDYLLVADIRSFVNLSYYDNVIKKFNKKNRFVFIYESIMYKRHLWKKQYLLNNFELIFLNSSIIVESNKNIYWIPVPNLYIQHSNYSNKKDKFCVVSPIFDLGILGKRDLEREKRLYIIKDFCDKMDNIDVYGSDQWLKIISKKNYVGLLPNENESGMNAKSFIDEKIKNKINTLSTYKFILVFENLFTDGYITEKLVESLYSSSVIIYYGPLNIKTIYNDLFDMCVINGHDYTIDQLINIMNNMTEIEYNLRINKMITIRDMLNINNNSENIKKFIISKITNYINNDENIENEINSIYSLEYINKLIKK